jgi:signal transduction histidine kinase
MLKPQWEVRDSAWRFAAPILLGSLTLALLTFIFYRLHFNLATAALFYLTVIVLLSLLADLVSPVLLSFMAVAYLAYFFAPPTFSFFVADPLNVVAIVAFLGTSLVIIGLVHKVRRLAEEALSSVRRQLVEAEDRERTRIARDLFDDICQRLALLTVQLQQLEAGPSSATMECPRGIEELRKETSNINIDVQVLAHELYFARLEYLGLAASMKTFCREFSAQQKVNIDFSNVDLPNYLPPHVSTCLFRVLQEALRNSAKHSGVHHFAVELRGSSDAIHLTVRDSGLGFNPEAKPHNGLGLISMEERLKLVNGRLSIDSQRNCGTTIHALVPLRSTSALPFASA